MVSALVALAQSISLPMLGITLVFVLVGTCIGHPPPGPATSSALLTMTVCWHASVYSLNNVIDRELDEANPARSGQSAFSSYLRGRLAVSLALLCGALGLAPLVRSSAPGPVLVLYASSIGLLWLYDYRSKNSRWPPFFDALQAIGWGLLLLTPARWFGATSAMALLMFGWSVFFIMLVNGGHGALRDAQNDDTHGKRTTATLALHPFLVAGLPPTVGGRYRNYLWGLNTVKTAVVILAGAVAATTGTRGAGIALVVLICLELGGGMLMDRGLKAYAHDPRYLRWGMLHIVVSLASAVVVAYLASGNVLLWAVPATQLALWLTARNGRRALKGVRLA